MTEVPDYVPMLVQGASDRPEEGGCLVQIANWLADPSTWTDYSKCVDPVLTHWAIVVNDIAGDETRHALALLAPRLAGTKIDDRLEEADIDAKLRQWLLENRSPITVNPGKKVEYIHTKNGFNVVLSPPTMTAVQDELHDWLSALIDEYDRLTGRGPVQDLTPQRWAEVRELVNQ